MSARPITFPFLVISALLCSLAEMTHSDNDKMSFHPFVRPYVLTYVHNQTPCNHKPVFDIGRSRQDIYKDMTFKVIRGRGRGHGPVKFVKMADFEVYFYRHLLRFPYIGDDSDTMGEYPIIIWPDFLIPLSLFLSDVKYGSE